MVTTIITEFRRLRRFKELASKINENQSSPAIAKMFKRWGVVYRSFAQRRYSTYSKGGGDWPPLKRPRKRDIKANARRVKKGKEPINPAILRDTSTLFMVLNPATLAPGAIEIRTGSGLILGYGGLVHPSTQVEGREIKTVAQIAGFHQIGAGRLPQRKIVVPPDPATLKSMTASTTAALKELLDNETR